MNKDNGTLASLRCNAQIQAQMDKNAQEIADSLAIVRTALQEADVKANLNLKKIDMKKKEIQINLELKTELDKVSTSLLI